MCIEMQLNNAYECFYCNSGKVLLPSFFKDFDQESIVRWLSWNKKKRSQ